MFENLMKCKDLMVRFGGHAMACGMTIRESDFETFSKRLNENSGLSPDDFISLLHIDIAMPIAAQTEEFIEELGALSPMGTGNPGPVFAEKGLKLIGINYMGSEKQHLKLYLLGKGDVKRYAVAFGAADDFNRFALDKFGEEELKKAESFKPNDIRLDIAYVPEINEYNGKRSIQLKLKAWK